LVQPAATTVMLTWAPEPWATEVGAGDTLTEAQAGVVTAYWRLRLASRLLVELPASLTQTPMFSMPAAAPVLFQL
jgi:hypothetical protein